MTRAYALEKLHESGDHGRNPFDSARRARARPGDPDMRLEPDRFDIEATDSIDQAQTGQTARSASSSLLAGTRNRPARRRPCNWRQSRLTGAHLANGAVIGGDGGGEAGRALRPNRPARWV